MRQFRSWAVRVAAALLVSFALGGNSLAQRGAPAAVSVPAGQIAEGNDYASRVLGNPWDMSSLADVSYYLNESGQRRVINNPAVSNGIFSGSSFNNAITGDGNAEFFPLFPGYIGESPSDPLYVPKNDLVGYNYPINASYSCLHVALRTESPAAIAPFGPDVMRIFWFADRNLNRAGGAFGQTFVPLYPEAAASQPTHRWQVISLNLAAPPFPVQQGVAWGTRSQWQGLRVDPTAIASGTRFEVDWVRLTNCAPVNRTITWTPSASVQALWVRPAGTTRDIRLQTVNGASGSATVDLQGLQAGSYTVGVGTLTSCCSERSTETLDVVGVPTGRFLRPSPASGSDYASSAGNRWNFGSDDVSIIRFVDGAPQPGVSFDSDGLLLTTPPGPLPAGIDVALNLNTPVPLDPNRYRYLTIDMETSWGLPWANIPDGMIGRWIWQIQGTSGRPGFRCTIVGPDIPYDVGRHQITLDLFDPVAGTAEESQGECPAGPLTWRTGPILALRFDPNENVTAVGDPISGGRDFQQRIRSIRLTQAEGFDSGQDYLASVSLSDAPAAVQTSFFYTNNLAQPTQNPAVAKTNPPFNGPVRAYLPLVITSSGADLSAANQVDFVWDTSGVAPGSYYLCARLTKGPSVNTICSQTQLQVR